MKRSRLLLTGIAALAIVILSGTSAHAATFSDTFDGPTLDPGWVPDRYAPQKAEVEGGKLVLGVNNSGAAANRPPAYSSSFYDTQGLKHDVDYTGASWQSSIDLTIGQSFVSGNNLRRTGWWTSTGDPGTETGAEYYILDVSRFDISSPYDNTAAGIASRWRAWDSDIGWVTLGLLVTPGDHTLDFLFTGSSVEYYIDGSLQYTDTTLGSLANHVRSVFVENFNFGDVPAGGGDLGGPTGYAVEYDNAYVGAVQPQNVPDGGSTALFACLGLGSLVFARSRSKA